MYDVPKKEKIPKRKFFHKKDLEAIPEGDESKSEEMVIQS